MPSSETLQPAIICMGGVLQYVERQFEPLRPVLRRYGDIECFAYEGVRFAPTAFQSAVAKRVRDHLLAGRPVIPIGASLGGMQIPYILAQLGDIDPAVVKRLLKAIVIDPPYGAKSLKAIPTWFAWVAALLTRIPLPAWLNGNVGKRILDGMAVPPEPQNIDVRRFDDPDAADRYQWHVIEESLKGLRGHRFSMFVSQLGWMMNAGSRRMPLSALDGVDVTYIACVGPNSTVRQPRAVDAWRPHVARVREVRTAHCAFLEQQQVYLELFKELLGRPHN